MADSEKVTLRRMLPRRLLWKGDGVWLAVWSAVAPVLLALILLTLWLLLGLLDSRGRTAIAGEDMPELRAQLGGTEVLPLIDEGRAVSLDNTGVLPTVASSQDRIWFRPLAALYRSIPALHSNVSTLTVLILTLVVLGVLRAVVLSQLNRAALRVAMAVASSQRRSIHRQALRLGPADLKHKQEESVLDLFSRQVDQLRDAVRSWTSTFIQSPWQILILLLLAISIDWRLTLLCLVPLMSAWWFAGYEERRGELRRRQAESHSNNELRFLAEGLRNARLVRGYAMEEFEQEQFTSHLERFSNETAEGLRYKSWAGRLSRILLLLCVCIVLVLIGMKVLAEGNRFYLADGLLLLAVFALLYPLAAELRKTLLYRRQIVTVGEHIQRYLSQVPEVGQAVGAKFLEPVSRTIIYESVSYHSGDGALLDGLDFRIPARTRAAIVSLEPLQARAAAYLLPRFIEPTKGRVLFDSEDIALATLESIRAETVFVGQDDLLFTGTALQNITCGDSNLTLQQATEAAKLVHAHSFITRLPQGYETVLGEHGESLPTGARFRLALARAVIRDPAVLIIEEPKVVLDDDTKALLDDAYQRITTGRTVIFLPSRLSTLRRCDQVVLIHEGKVAGLGSHNDLLRQSDTYRHWEYVNFSKWSRQPRSVDLG